MAVNSKGIVGCLGIAGSLERVYPNSCVLPL